MTEQHPTRRELLKPVQLLGLAFVAALFAGVVTLFSMGAFQEAGAVAADGLDPRAKAWMTAGIVAGITFIVTTVTIALLMLAVDPAQISKTVDRPVLMRDQDVDPATGGSPVRGDDSPNGLSRGH